MKLIIDISKDRYDEIMSMDWKNCRLIFDEELRAIHDGKALEQEPCTDCISKQDAIDACLNGWNKDYKEIVEEIRALPPITPQPKTGRWEWVPFGYPSILGNWVCSKCKCVAVEAVSKENKHEIPTYKYCPNCGAKLQEVKDEVSNV